MNETVKKTVRDFRDPGNPAPGSLEVVRQFINTSTEEKDYDAFATEEGAVRWLRETGLPPPETALDSNALERLRSARDALRALAMANREGDDYGPLVALLNRILRDAPVAVQFRPDASSELVPVGDGVDEVLGRILAILHDAAVDGSWRRMKACRECHWAFFDRSRNLSGQWCSMRVCGSRVKMRRARARTR